jgi:acetate kinase
MTVGAYAALLGGLEALVLTGGVGEHSWRARGALMERLAFLGVREDPVSNRSGSGDRRISGEDSRVKVWALHAREDRTIARETERVVGGDKIEVPKPGGVNA